MIDISLTRTCRPFHGESMEGEGSRQSHNVIRSLSVSIMASTYPCPASFGTANAKREEFRSREPLNDAA